MIYTLLQDGFGKVNNIGQQTQRTLTTDLINDGTALQMQDNSLDEYQDTHVQESLTPQMRYLSNCFRLFINYHLPTASSHTCLPFSDEQADTPYGIAPRLSVLDVGCGISKKFLLIFEIANQGKVTYVGLDPFEVNTDVITSLLTVYSEGFTSTFNISLIV